MNEAIYYMVNTYGDDGAEKLSKVKMISHILLPELDPNYKKLIDKIALFNGISKVI